MENLMEMEYVINGEKYRITATKVEETNDESANNTHEVIDEPIDLSDVLPEFEADGPLKFSITDIPEGLSVEEWLTIIREFNIILIK